SCALDENGNLKDAADIVWYHDKDTETPIASSGSNPLGRGHRTHNTARMADILDAEQDSDTGGGNSKPRQSHKRRRKAKRKPKINNDTDIEDASYTASSSEESSDELDSDVMEITNAELANSLPSKTVPTKDRTVSAKANRKSRHAKKRSRPTIGDISDAEAPLPPRPHKLPNEPVIKKASGKRNPIYHFYEEVSIGSNGTAGAPGDKHYRCYHGARKTLTVTKAMNHSLNGLIGHLKNHFKPMHQLFLVMKDCNRELTSDEILFAQAKKPFDSSVQAGYLRTLEKQAAGIKEAFAKQQEAAKEPWNQKRFEELLIRWIVACDQPFDEVEKPEFIDMMNYGRQSIPDFSLPKRDGVHRRIMTLSDSTVADIKDIFAVGLILIHDCP
ncbi:hypothetical protein H0H92_010903, partial [Tricholoma furcatifolium]